MTKPDYTSLRFPGPPRDRPYTILNMVSSLDGQVSVEGTEEGLGSEIDHRLMRELRTVSDIVLVGAETLRKTGASPRVHDPALERLRVERGLPALPISAVLSRSGDLPLDRIFFTADDFESVVYLSRECPPVRREAILNTGRRVVDLEPGAEVPAMLRHMRDVLRSEVLLLETGPKLNRQLFEQGLVDEFFLTLGPVVAGGGGPAALAPPSFGRAAMQRLELVSVYPNQDTSEVYLRYRRAS